MRAVARRLSERAHAEARKDRHDGGPGDRHIRGRGKSGSERPAGRAGGDSLTRIISRQELATIAVTMGVVALSESPFGVIGAQ